MHAKVCTYTCTRTCPVQIHLPSQIYIHTRLLSSNSLTHLHAHIYIHTHLSSLDSLTHLHTHIYIHTHLSSSDSLTHLHTSTYTLTCPAQIPLHTCTHTCLNHIQVSKGVFKLLGCPLQLCTGLCVCVCTLVLAGMCVYCTVQFRHRPVCMCVYVGLGLYVCVLHSAI